MTNTDQKVIFIVGNSRSGTTMMLRILSNHPEIHTLNELHFFEQLWSTSDTHKELTGQLAAELASKLLFVQRDGYIGKTHVAKYLEEGHQIIQQLGNSPLFGHSVLIAMMNYETALNNRSIPCEKTPQNVFYLAEILSLYPNARIINMIRDPKSGDVVSKTKMAQKKNGGNLYYAMGSFPIEGELSSDYTK